MQGQSRLLEFKSGEVGAKAEVEGIAKMTRRLYRYCINQHVYTYLVRDPDGRQLSNNGSSLIIALYLCVYGHLFYMCVWY